MKIHNYKGTHHMAIRKKFISPDKITITVFIALLALPLQYFLFIALFPDGDFEMVRSMLDTLTEVVLFPANLFLGGLASILEPVPLVTHGRLPGGIGLIIYMVYFYIIGALVSSLYDLTVKGNANKT
ncbi:hypothetical protein [Natronorubrum sp. DTA28]|uniref:hypothetical protein n=1 Tax=Natronorubrum sp. DTA28 TaxID=3447019 RepID=UPI003F86FF00